MLIVLVIICIYLLVLTARLKSRADRQQELIDELRSRLDALADARASAPAGGPINPELRAELRELKRRGIEHLKVVYSREKPLEPLCPGGEPEPGRRAVPGSVAFVPAAAGLILAGEVVKDIALK